MNLSRRNFLAAGGAAALAGATGCKSGAERLPDKEFVLSPNGRKLHLPWPGLREKVRVWVAGDTHFGMYDERDAQYADNYRRMSWKPEGYPETVKTHKAAFEKMLADAKGDPVALVMHVPMYVPGWGVFTCGCPDWGAAKDPYWEIERREKWRAEGPTPESFEFREAVLSTPNLVGVFTGHFHVPMCAHLRGQNLFSVVSNGEGKFLDVQIG